MVTPHFYVGSLQVDAYPYSVRRGSDTLDIGAGENISAVVESLLVDGDDLRSIRTGNREMVLPVFVEGTSLADLAANEAALLRECDKERNTFTLDPGDGVLSVWDTFRVRPSHARNDAQESALVRRWDLTIPALPGARPEDTTTVSFSAATAADTTVDAASATTNWSVNTGSFGGNPATLSAVTYSGESAVKVTPTGDAVNLGDGLGSSVALQWGGAAATTTYIWFDVLPEYAFYGSNPVRVAFQDPVATVLTSTGYVRYYFERLGLTPYQLTVQTKASPGATVSRPPTGWYLGGYGTSDVIPASSLMMVSVPGSMRTTGSVTVTRVSNNIVDLFVYSDPTMLTYGWIPDDTSTWQYAPKGRYVIFVNPLFGSGSYKLTATLPSGATQVQYAGVNGTTSSKWDVVGVFDLGGNRDGQVGSVTWSTTGSSGTPSSFATSAPVMFRLADDASLMYFSKTGGTDRAVYVDAPSLENATGGLYRGATDPVDASQNAVSFGFPVLVPPLTALYVSTAPGTVPSTDIPQVTVDFYPRFHGYVAA